MPGRGNRDNPATLAVVWQRFGPYHLARLRGATDVLSGEGWHVVGLEVAGRDHYEWMRVEIVDVPRRTLFSDRQYSSISSLEIRRAVTRALDALNPMAVCINGWSATEAVAALTWCKRSGARAVLMSETFESPFNPLKQAVKRWRIAHCDAAIVGGRLHARYLENLGFSSRSLELGYDTVDNDHFSAPASTRPAWATGTSGERYFFANTRFLERKGIDALLRAYAQYLALSRAARAETWGLAISGSGEMERPWKELSVALEVAESVTWPGFLQYEQLPSAYQHAGAFVHPARREPWGLVINEAAAAGLPMIVGCNVGAACELVREGENGFLIDPDDVDGFAKTLLRISTLSESERSRMGQRSREIVAAFGPARFGQALAKCLGVGPVKTGHHE